ncbi:hypothetical protein J6590_063506 [Homalodisca vitripennis]|nr:hypothetical protein J6590_063506 [Homalodisca vitripennis]
MSVLLVLLYAVCLLLLTMYLRFRWQYRHVLAVATKLPCPPTLPIIGNALLFFGDITGPIPIFVVVDPADIQIVLNSSSMLEKDNLYSLFGVFLGNSIISSPVHIWKKYRRLMNPVMHPSNVEHFLPVFNEVGRKLTEQLSVSSPPSDRTDEIFELTVIAGTKAKSVLHNIGKLLILRLFKFWLHIDWVFKLLYGKEINECLKIRDKCMSDLSQEWKEGATIENEVIPGANKNSERTTLIVFHSCSDPRRTAFDCGVDDQYTSISRDFYLAYVVWVLQYHIVTWGGVSLAMSEPLALAQ